MRIEARVGVARYADDNEGPPRIGNQGEQIVAELNPKYYEQTMRGNAFMYSAASAGAVLNVLSTTSAPLVWNPAGSGKNLIITKITVGLDATGTTAAGHIVYGTQSNLGSQIGTGAPVVSGTFVSGVNLLIGSGLQSAMRFAPTTVTLTAACTFLCTMGLGQATAATTATSPFMAVDDVDGRIIIPPGSGFVVAASAAIASSYTVSIYGLELLVPLTQ